MSLLKKCALGYLFACSIGQKDNRLSKKGIPLSAIKNQIRPLDLILFKGNDGVSETVRMMEKEVLGNGDWSHCGIILTTDVVPIKNGIPGELYIWESTFDLIKDVELDDYVFGVQIRSFDEVVQSYNQPRDTSIAWCKLKDNPIFSEKNNISEIKEKLLNLYQVYNHVGYNYSPCDLISTIHPKSAVCFNCCCCCCNTTHASDRNKENRQNKEEKREENKEDTDEMHQLLGQKEIVQLYIKSINKSNIIQDLISDKVNTRLFCSELVSLIYIKLGIFPAWIKPNNIAPVEFLGYTNEKNLPIVVDPPVVII